MTHGAQKCGTIRVHHSDCACLWCRCHLDERCDETTIGITEDRVRVCEECAVAMHVEGFAVIYDDGRLGVAS